MLRPIYFCKTFPAWKTYPGNVLYVIVRFLRISLENATMQCSIFSAYEFYILISNNRNSKIAILTKVSYKIISFVIISTSMLLFTFRLFEFQMIPENSNNNLTQSSSNITVDQKIILVSSDYSNSTWYKVMKLFGIINLNGVSIIVLMLINILIGKSVKESIYKKKYIQNNSNNKTKNKEDEIQVSLRLMIYYGSIQNIFGRMPSLIFYIINSFVKNLHHDFDYIIIVSIFFFYFSKFPMFFFTNKMFESVAIQYLKYVFSLFKFR